MQDFLLKKNLKTLAARLRPDPLGELMRSRRPLSCKKRRKGEGRRRGRQMEW